MATVMEPRNPVLLAPFVVAQWLNTYLSLAVAIVMITEHKHIEIWGYIG